MKIYFYFLVLVSVLLVFLSCGGEKLLPGKETQELPADRRLAILPQTPGDIDLTSLLRSLDELAEVERSGSWHPGLALTESGIRESAGDYAGAVAAAYKELALAYGRGLIKKEDIEQRLLNLLETNSDETVAAAANVILSFFREQWTAALAGLEVLFDQHEEPDSFASWMILTCTLEKNRVVSEEDRRTGAAYKAIRARYAQFPEYWYRGARVFSGTIAAEYAENCINVSVQGPFAEECRKILAVHCGLNTDDGKAIKTKREIEVIISESVNSGNPLLLAPLLPLINLPDNPYTVYAVGALRSLSSIQLFNGYFSEQALVSQGRLAERLSYICRG